MKKTTKLFAIIGIISIVAFYGCKKEKVKGCMTSTATNFKSNAQEDDGSCTYNGSVVFWVMTGDMSPSGGEGVNVYINNVFQGNIGVTFGSAPTCDGTGALTIHKDLGKNKYQSYSVTYKVVQYGVEDTDPANWGTETVNFFGTSCTSHRIQ